MQKSDISLGCINVYLDIINNQHILYIFI